MNISIAIAESILKHDKTTQNSLLNEMRLVRRQRFVQYTQKSELIKSTIDKLSKREIGQRCSNCNEELKDTWRVCPACETKITEEQSIYFELLRHPIDRLYLSDRIKERIKNHEGGKFKTVEDIMRASLRQLDEISYIGPVRAKAIEGAAIEYVAA